MTTTPRALAMLAMVALVTWAGKAGAIEYDRDAAVYFGGFLAAFAWSMRATESAELDAASAGCVRTTFAQLWDQDLYDRYVLEWQRSEGEGQQFLEGLALTSIETCTGKADED